MSHFRLQLQLGYLLKCSGVPHINFETVNDNFVTGIINLKLNLIHNCNLSNLIVLPQQCSQHTLFAAVID